MIFKNKKFKTAMATLAILTIFGGTVSSAYAAELTKYICKRKCSKSRIKNNFKT